MAWITKGDPQGASADQEIINRFTFRVTGPVDPCPHWKPTFYDQTSNSEREYYIDAGGSLTIDGISPDLTGGCEYYTTLAASGDGIVWKGLNVTELWPVLDHISGLEPSAVSGVGS